MSFLSVDIGGRPGLDCRGFCSYCYFRGVSEVAPLGCRHCPPFSSGCDYCTRSVREFYGEGFIPLRDVADTVLARLQGLNDEVSRITISGGGDPSCYPDFRDLVDLLASMEAPLHIGYTSGKGFDDPKIADFLIDSGLSEVSFTVFASDPGLRKRFMHDPTPDASLKVLDRLCEAIDVYAAAVVVPGINDGKVLEDTCAWLDNRGAQGLILMRFANQQNQGLILGNAPVMPGVVPHTIDEFKTLVTSLNVQYDLKVSGTPLWDPTTRSPFAILQEPDLLAKLPRLSRKASVVTGSVAAPYLAAVLDALGGTATVVPVDKEIACLITLDDLSGTDPSGLEDLVVIPGRAFVHDTEAARVLSRDGHPRTLMRGPDTLTADAETSMGMTRDAVLSMEMEGISTLVQLINRFGS
ncbi:MAG: methyl coenzyme M reductase-arginine methyltransferase Mmp10 [Methanomicrobiales archaeon]|nr:methyl coenzyme M reductase-arginine methyltransferase Mmp10 [Methanomicrobiales archaeon]